MAGKGGPKSPDDPELSLRFLAAMNQYMATRPADNAEGKELFDTRTGRVIEGKYRRVPRSEGYTLADFSQFPERK